MSDLQDSENPDARQPLKRCSVCGAAADADDPKKLTDSSGSFWEVLCKGLDCIVSAIGTTRAEAIAAWNRRAGETT